MTHFLLSLPSLTGMSPRLLGAMVLIPLLLLVVFMLFQDTSLPSSMSFESDSPHVPAEGHGRPIWAWFIWAVALGATLVIWLAHRNLSGANRQEQFAEESQALQSSLAANVDRVQMLLHDAAVLWGSQPVTQEKWKGYVSALDLGKHAPGMTGVGYAAAIQGSALDSFLRTMRGEGTPTFKVSPAGRRSAYVIVRAVEPGAANADLMGFDFASDAALRSAVELARDTGNASFSGRVRAESDLSAGVLYLFSPVFNQVHPPQTMEERAATLKGWVFARIQMSDFFAASKADAPDLNWQVYDGPSITPDALIYETQKMNSGAASPFTATQTVTPGGRSWTINIVAQSGFSKGGDLKSWLILGVGGGISFLLLAFLSTLHGAKKGKAGLDRVTDSLREREQLLGIAPVGVVLVDAREEDHPIRFVNRRFERLTGYSSGDVLGKNCRFLLGPDTDQKGCEDLRTAMRERKEGRAVLRNYRKDGGLFWNALAVVPMRDDEGIVTQYAWFQQDVTDYEQFMRAQATQVAVDEALSQATTMETAAAAVLQALGENQGWSLGVAWFADPSAHVLRCSALWHAPGVEADAFERFSLGTTFPKEMGFPGHIWSLGEPVWLGDLAKENRFPQASMATQLGLLSACGFPIVANGAVLGVVEFYGRKIALDKSLLVLLDKAGHQLGGFTDQEPLDPDSKTPPPPLSLVHELQKLRQQKDDMLQKEQSLQADLRKTDEERATLHQERDQLQADMRHAEAEQGTLRQERDQIEDQLRAAAQREADLRLQIEILQQAVTEVKTTPLAHVSKELEPEGISTESDDAPHLLFLEEDGAVRAEVGKRLENEGFRVILAAHAQEAIRKCSVEPDPVDLLITDAILPQMHVHDLVRQLTQKHPELKVLYVSRHTQESLQNLHILEATTPYLRIPFTPEALVQRVREVIGKRLTLKPKTQHPKA